MIVFVDAQGNIKHVSIATITQGSVNANDITLVGPFPSATVTIAFTLPNGIVLDPVVAGLPKDYTMT